MLGYYHYGVILTYLSMVSSVIGISMTLNGRHITLAIVCLMVSGCLDAFDGRVARTRKNATDEEKSFGIQIDSLCDMVCFGVLPACIGFACGLNKWYHIAILALFVLAALIRLGYYNVMEMAQKNVDESGQRFFRGLPVTSIAIILPLCALSSAIYFLRGGLDLTAALPYLAGGLAGGFLGGRVFKRLNMTWLRRAFALLILYGGVKALLF